MRVAQAIARHRKLDITEAAALGDARAIGELVGGDPGAVRARSQDGWTALHLAAFLGHADVARQLLDAGADIEASSDNYMRNRPLHAALAGKGDPETVRLLLDRQADVGAVAATGVTPLHTAASRGATDFISMLLARGADRSARLDDGMTAAQVAEKRGHPQAAALLATDAGARG
jgi:ankyrin repeat protein